MSDDVVSSGGRSSVLVAGPASWNQLVFLDRLPQPSAATIFARRHHDVLGGTSAGKAINLAALGVHVTLRTVVGTDEWAPSILAPLERAGVDVIAEVVAGPSERHLNLMTASGERISIYLELPSAPTRSGVADDETRLDAALAACDVAVVDLSEHSRPLLRRAQALSKPIWCDVHDYDGVADYHREFVDAADVLFLNDDAMPDPLPFMEARVAAGTSIVVVTQGARGATAVSADGRITVPADHVESIVDTNGAGDAFFAGFLAAHLAGASPGSALSAGASRAAKSLQVIGFS